MAPFNSGVTADRLTSHTDDARMINTLQGAITGLAEYLAFNEEYTMATLDLNRILGSMDELSVGYKNFFNDFQASGNHFPPHNIVKVSDSEFFLELAVAGFTRDELTIREQAGRLIVTGNRQDRNENYEYQYRGIASRSFEKQFKIATQYELKSAELTDGILKITYVREEEQPAVRTITIM